MEDVKNGGLHVIELKFATCGCDRKNQLRDPDVEGPSPQECVRDEFIQVLNIVPRSVVGINDLVQSEQSDVIVIGKMCIDLGGQDVIVVVK